MKGADPKFQGWPESLRKWYTASLRSDHLTTCTSEGPWNEHLDAQLEIFWASKTVGRGRAPTTLTALWIGQQGPRPVPLHWQRSRRCVLPGGLRCAFSTADLSGQQWKWNVKWQFVLSFLFTKQKVPQFSERFDCLLSSVKPATTL